MNAGTVYGEQPALYIDRMNTIGEKLAEIGIAQSDHETNLYIYTPWRSLDYGVYIIRCSMSVISP